MFHSIFSRSTRCDGLLVKLALVLAVPVLFACESDSLKPEPLSEEEAPWELGLNHRGVLLSTEAPHNTLTLSVTPRNVFGRVLAGLPAPEFTSTDFQQILVTPEGIIQAVTPTTGPVWIRVTQRTENFKLVDSVLVQAVTVDPPPILETFSAKPVAPDTAKLGLNALALYGVPVSPLSIKAFDTNGSPMEGLPVSYRSSDITVAEVDPLTGAIQGKIRGTFKVYVQTTAFGVAKVDTVPFQIGWPIYSKIILHVQTRLNGDKFVSFLPSEVTIGAGGMVEWDAGNARGAGFLPFDITFDADKLSAIAAPNTSPLYGPPPLFFSNPMINCEFANLLGREFADCNDDNALIVMPNAGGGAIRVFTVPGTYNFQSTLHGLSGRVTVVGDE